MGRPLSMRRYPLMAAHSWSSTSCVWLVSVDFSQLRNAVAAEISSTLKNSAYPAVSRNLRPREKRRLECRAANLHLPFAGMLQQLFHRFAAVRSVNHIAYAAHRLD